MTRWEAAAAAFAIAWLALHALMGMVVLAYGRAPAGSFLRGVAWAWLIVGLLGLAFGVAFLRGALRRR